MQKINEIFKIYNKKSLDAFYDRSKSGINIFNGDSEKGYMHDYFMNLFKNIMKSKKKYDKCLLIFGPLNKYHQYWPTKILNPWIKDKKNIIVLTFEPLIVHHETHYRGKFLKFLEKYEFKDISNENICFKKDTVDYHIFPYAFDYDNYGFYDMFTKYFNNILGRGGEVVFCDFMSYVIDFNTFDKIYEHYYQKKEKNFTYLKGSCSNRTYVCKFLKYHSYKSNVITDIEKVITDIGHGDIWTYFDLV